MNKLSHYIKLVIVLCMLAFQYYFGHSLQLFRN